MTELGQRLEAITSPTTSGYFTLEPRVKRDTMLVSLLNNCESNNLSKIIPTFEIFVLGVF